MKRRFMLAWIVALGCGGDRTPTQAHEISTARVEKSADESAPATWIARLDDDGRRAEAIGWLLRRYDEQHDASLVEPLTKVYVRGHLDDATRLTLVRWLTSTDDPRTSPALVKALGGYEPGKMDEDVKLAAQRVLALVKVGAHLDASLVDALWAGFAKYQPSRAKSIMGAQALHDAVLAVKDPSYGPKATAMIATELSIAEVTRPGVDDQLQFWQTTAIQVVRALEYKPAARTLVAVLVTTSKSSLAPLVRSALMHMPSEAEPVLVLALKGDPEFAKLQHDWPDKGYVPILLDVLSYVSTDAARDAVIAYVPQLDNDANRAAAATSLVHYAPSPSVISTFKRIYDKLPPIAAKPDGDTGAERAQLLGVVGELFDASLGPWALAQASSATGESTLAAKANAIQSAIKLMRQSDKPAVLRAIANLALGLSPQQRQVVVDDLEAMFQGATAALDKCATNASCYAQIVDKPIAKNGKWKAVKAAYMAGILGNDPTRKELVARLTNITDPRARLAVAVAIAHLAPKGDAADADALDKVAQGDPRANDLANVAQMLRARAQ